MELNKKTEHRKDEGLDARIVYLVTRGGARRNGHGRVERDTKIFRLSVIFDLRLWIDADVSALPPPRPVLVVYRLQH